MALISKVDRVTRALLTEWQTHIVERKDKVRVSQLSPEEQAEFWRRDKEWHPSSGPYCGLRDAYERYIRGEDPEIEQDFSSDYYLNVGTVTHDAVQTWLGKSGKIIGKWRCEDCGNTRSFGPYPGKCKCGSIRIKYEELGGNDGVISWHTDGLFKYGDEYWLVDYKTSSMFAIQKAIDLRKQGKKTDLPYKKNVVQIENYTVLVERRYNIKITGWLLVYLPRDNPKQNYWIFVAGKQLTDDRREELGTRIDNWAKDFKVAQQVTTKPIAVFKRLMPTKLCDSKEFYDEWVGTPFEQCPLAENGCCFRRSRLVAHIKQTLSG